MTTISTGFTDEERPKVAALFWAAFGQKLRILNPEEKALRFIEKILQPRFALVARNDEGTLIGVTGFKTEKGGLVGGGYRDMARIYGWFGGFWRGVLLEQLERKIRPEELLMDGIFVAPEARGTGTGTALLRALSEKAKSEDYARMRLDVIDSNPRAKELYTREGFVPSDTISTGPLAFVFGFKRATTMVKEL